MTTLPDGLLDEVVRRLVDELDPDRIILFGSHAWGVPGPDSDLDLMIVVPSSRESGVQGAVRGHLCLRDLPVSKDIIVKTHAEFERLARIEATLMRRIKEHGRILHESRSRVDAGGLAAQGR